MRLLVVCVSSHGAVGGSVILTYFLDVCGDTELTSGMRRVFYSVMPDHKKASMRVK